MDCLTERENQWSLIFSVRYRKLNEIHLHYLLRYLPSWQFGSPVWSLQGSYPLLLTAHILLCIWPAQKRSHKISHVTNTVKNCNFFYINYLNRIYSWYNNTTTSEKKNVYSHHWWYSVPGTLSLSPGCSPSLNTRSAAVRTQTETERPVYI